MRNALPILLLLSALHSPSGYARVIVPNANDSGAGAGSIHTYPDGWTGDVVPLSSIVPGEANPIASATAVEYEPIEDVLYVADFRGQAVRVYDAQGNGGVAPLRTLASSMLGQVRVVRIDRARDELVAIAGMMRVCTWPRLASGENVMPTRCIPWGGNSDSQLNNPAGLALNRARREIVVGDYVESAPFANRILIFPRTADAGSNAPVRVIEGGNTGLGAGSNVRVVVDEQHQLIIALVGATVPDAGTTARVLVFPADADGDATPIRVIEGAASGLQLEPGEYPSGLGYDEVNQAVLVAIATNGSGTSGRVVAHWELASIGSAPLYTLAGGNTGISAMPGAPTATTHNLFRDGFD